MLIVRREQGQVFVPIANLGIGSGGTTGTGSRVQSELLLCASDILPFKSDKGCG